MRRSGKALANCDPIPGFGRYQDFLDARRSQLSRNNVTRFARGSANHPDGEFDIFQNITAEQVQRVANTYFKKENRLVMTIMPSGGGR